MRTRTENPFELDTFSKIEQIFYRRLSSFPFSPSSRRYNITISDEHKFIWFRVAKVGTRTILRHIEKSGIHLDCGHPSFIQYPANKYKNFFKFAFIRNPFDRFASCWRDKVVRQNHFNFEPSLHRKFQKFSNFVDFCSDIDVESCERHLRSQAALIDLNNIDYLGRMENFNHDLSHVFGKVGILFEEIERKNATSSKEVANVYSPQSRSDISRLYAKDFQIFGYDT